MGNQTPGSLRPIGVELDSRFGFIEVFCENNFPYTYVMLLTKELVDLSFPQTKQIQRELEVLSRNSHRLFAKTHRLSFNHNEFGCSQAGFRLHLDYYRLTVKAVEGAMRKLSKAFTENEIWFVIHEVLTYRAELARLQLPPRALSLNDIFVTQEFRLAFYPQLHLIEKKERTQPPASLEQTLFTVVAEMVLGEVQPRACRQDILYSVRQKRRLSEGLSLLLESLAEGQLQEEVLAGYIEEHELAARHLQSADYKSHYGEQSDYG